MKVAAPLLLASSSASRRMLLTLSQIPFRVISQTYDESQAHYIQPLECIAQEIASNKMNAVVLPNDLATDTPIFILTADTISQDARGMIQDKPRDRTDAIAKIKAARNGIYLCSGICMERRSWNGTTWQTEERIEQVVEARFVFDVPDDRIDDYLRVTMSMTANGALAVEDYGLQFLKTVHGSYSTIIGLPLFEVRTGLEQLGFFRLIAF